MCVQVVAKVCTSVSLQWMVTGQSGQSGRSAHAPAVKATEPGCGPALTPQLNMEAASVKGRQWRQSCAASDRVQVNKHNVFFSHNIIIAWDILSIVYQTNIVVVLV